MRLWGEFMNLTEYLFHRLRELGVGHTFGIPGDFVLPVYAVQEQVGMPTVVCAHEPGVGFAADAYARFRGLGVALVTYGPGALNTLNPVACAYAEQSPLLVVSGGPEVALRRPDLHLHHVIKTFESQLQIYREVTVDAAILDDPASAPETIDRVLRRVVESKRPGYLEIPRDRVTVPVADPSGPLRARSHGRGARGPLRRHRRGRDRDRSMLVSASRPGPLRGRRCPPPRPDGRGGPTGRAAPAPGGHRPAGQGRLPGESPPVRGGLPGAWATRRPRTGRWLGLRPADRRHGDRPRDRVLDPAHPPESPRDDRHRMASRSGTIATTACPWRKSSPHCSTGCRPAIAPSPRFDGPASDTTSSSAPAADPGLSRPDILRVAEVIAVLQGLDQSRYSFVADVGDSWFIGLELRADVFVAAGYYSSMGFAVPAALGAGIAEPSRRPMVIVGDGAFQMTGIELATHVEQGCGPSCCC